MPKWPADWRWQKGTAQHLGSAGHIIWRYQRPFEIVQNSWTNWVWNNAWGQKYVNRWRTPLISLVDSPKWATSAASQNKDISRITFEKYAYKMLTNCSRWHLTLWWNLMMKMQFVFSSQTKTAKHETFPSVTCEPANYVTHFYFNNDDNLLHKYFFN